MERTVTVRTELESILVEQASSMARELEAVADAADDGWPGLLDHIGSTPTAGHTAGDKPASTS